MARHARHGFVARREHAIVSRRGATRDRGRQPAVRRQDASVPGASIEGSGDDTEHDAERRPDPAARNGDGSAAGNGCGAATGNGRSSEPADLDKLVELVTEQVMAALAK